MKLQDIIDEIFEETTNEDLRNWFKSKWVNIGKKDKSGKHPPCGTSGKKKGYAKCVPAAKAKTMSKKEKESATRRKRAAQNKSNRGVLNLQDKVRNLLMFLHIPKEENQEQVKVLKILSIYTYIKQCYI